METLNVAYNSPDPDAKILSNLAPTPFMLHGHTWGSVEAFWKTLYLAEDERAIHSDKSGIQACKIFLDQPYPETILYRGRIYTVGSIEHQTLMEVAIRAKISQNTEVRQALRRTRGKILEHIPHKNDGTPFPDSKTIPGSVFARILTVLRDEL